MTVTQTCFTAALFDPEAPVPAGLSDPEGRAAGKRFDVYRNNVTVSLVEALKTAFPVIARLLGETNFTTLARAYLRTHPPRSPLMMFYGQDMPAFLAGFPPVATLGYLPDMARLEIAIRESYHAADAPPLDPDRLRAADPEALMALKLGLAPAVRLVRSDWPIHAIWTYNMAEDAPKPAMQGEDVLVARPDYDPVPVLLPPGGAAFVSALAAGAPLGAAHETALAARAGFDLSATLSLLLMHNALSDP